ncbi:MAG TPA: DUF305 domain-containing protein [Rubricoccaceae bacterium]|nr:DUF305 domain-containing protein [Rubricoccaceae bacterium]
MTVRFRLVAVAALVVCAAIPLPARAQPAEADVRFMQGMIPHHAQALDMTALVPDRSSRPDLLLLAERIEVAQTDEIAWMTRWLRDHGAAAPDPSAHARGDGHHALMPGMLSPEEMAHLAGATGPEFDRLFLQYMIRHHEGALVMVSELLAAEGAAQAPEVFQFASDIEAGQRAEIARMRALLGDDAPPLPEPHHH